MKNFQFEHNGKEYWYSRSVACTMYYFVFNIATLSWYVLISKRGPGCPSNVGKWNVPGGYLDFDETLEQAARRECYEETGVMVPEKIQIAKISSTPYSKTQNVVCSFFATWDAEDVMNIVTDTRRSEEGEVSEVKFIPVEDVDKYCFAFGQDKMIKEIFDRRVNVGMVSRWLIDKAEQLTKINTEVE